MTGEEAIRKWKADGCPVPPPHEVKANLIKHYATIFSIGTMIETGTYLGDMIWSTKDHFNRICSIELDEQLHQKAVQRFSLFPHIALYQGDSGIVIPQILQHISEPCLFWLDAHYCYGISAKGETETPIFQELDYILSHSVQNHVILIDDARCFTGHFDYPLINEIRDYISGIRPDMVLRVKDDIMRVYKGF